VFQCFGKLRTSWLYARQSNLLAVPRVGVDLNIKDMLALMQSIGMGIV